MIDSNGRVVEERASYVSIPKDAFWAALFSLVGAVIIAALVIWGLLQSQQTALGVQDTKMTAMQGQLVEVLAEVKRMGDRGIETSVRLQIVERDVEKVKINMSDMYDRLTVGSTPFERKK